MTPTTLLPPRLDQLARLLALGWSDERIAGETGLMLSSVASSRWRLAQALGCGPPPPGAAAAQTARRLTVRLWVSEHPLPLDRACLHCPGVPVVRGARGSETGWELRQRARLCRRCWQQWLEARWRA